MTLFDGVKKLEEIRAHKNENLKIPEKKITQIFHYATSRHQLLGMYAKEVDPKERSWGSDPRSIAVNLPGFGLELERILKGGDEHDPREVLIIDTTQDSTFGVDKKGVVHHIREFGTKLLDPDHPFIQNADLIYWGAYPDDRMRMNPDHYQDYWDNLHKQQTDCPNHDGGPKIWCPGCKDPEVTDIDDDPVKHNRDVMESL